MSKQLLAIALGIIAFIVLSKVPYKWWRSMTKPLIIASIIVALIVQLFGSRVNGAYRWIQIGGVSFQAAELIKFAFLVWLADLLASVWQNGRLNDAVTTLKPLGIALGAIVVVVGFIESDLGSTAVMVGMACAMIFVKMTNGRF